MLLTTRLLAWRNAADRAGHDLGIGGVTLQQKDGHDSDGRQVKLQIVGLPLIRFSWK